MLQEALHWYLAPWRRMARVTFNTVLGVATIPALLVDMNGTVEGTADLMTSVGGLMDGGRQLEQGSGLQEALLGLLGLGASEPVAQGIDWSAWLVLVTWVVLFPVLQMRMRDMGMGVRRRWFFSAFVYVPLVMAAVERVWMGDVFSWWGEMWAGVGSFLTIALLCMWPSSKRVTNGGGSGKLGADDSLDATDPYPPFRP